MRVRGAQRRVPRGAAVVLALGALLATVAVAVAGARGIEPVASWLYPFAWYPLLLAFEGAVAFRTGRFLLLGRPGRLLSVLAWSVPVWILWELLNFRLGNWYYVFVPDRRAEFWAGVAVSFATVLPACFLPAALIRSFRSGRRPADPPAAGPTLGNRTLHGVRAAGLTMLALPLVWPRIFFPLVWGAFVLLAEPDVHRSAPSRSLLTDVLEGRWGRIGALLGGGAVAGLAWEALNTFARSRWIYTVPGLEHLKLFEMPPLGFLGFPPLALSCWAIYQWLGDRGWAAPLDLPPRDGGSEGGRFRPSPGARRAWTGAAILVVIGLLGMESFTVSSTTPRLRDLPGLLPSAVETLEAWGVESPFGLAGHEPGELSERIPGVSEEEARSWIASARLATTRGIGARNARLLDGWAVGSLEALARTDPEALARCFAGIEGRSEVQRARVHVWWRAARRETGYRGPALRPPRC